MFHKACPKALQYKFKRIEDDDDDDDYDNTNIREQVAEVDGGSIAFVTSKTTGIPISPNKHVHREIHTTLHWDELNFGLECYRSGCVFVCMFANEYLVGL